MSQGQPLTPEALVYGITTPAEARISPDGTRIVYSLTTTDPDEKRATTQLWLCAPDGTSKGQLTLTGARNRAPCWSSDGASVAFVSESAPRAGIFVLPLKDGPVKNGLEPRAVVRERREIADLAWSPDGRTFAYTMAIDPENPDELERPAGALPPVRVTRRLDYKSDGRSYLGDRRSQVFIVNRDGSGRRQLTTDTVDHNRPTFSPDSQWLAYQVAVAESQATRLVIENLSTGARRIIGAEQGVASLWAWSPDGGRILFAGDTITASGQYDFFEYDVASGQTRRVTNDLACQPDGGRLGQAPPTQPVWLDNQRVLFNAFHAGATELNILDIRSGAVELVVISESLNAGLSVDSAQRYVVQTQISLRGPNELRIFDLEQRTTRIISDYNAVFLKSHPPARVERIQRTRGGFTTDAWLLTPPDFDPARRYPIVLDVHGGPQGFYGYDFDPVQQLLSTQGFVVLFCNPRGSTTYGRDFTQQVWGDWGGEDYLDLMAVLDDVVQRPYVDAARQGIYGSSYGGYMTAWAITQTDRFKAAVSRAPIFNLQSFYGTSDIGYTWSSSQFGGAPHEASDFYATRSPSTFAHRVKTPTLVMHGEDDQRCPIGEGEQMFVALRKAGCETEFVRYPHSSHLFFRAAGPPEYRIDFLSRVLGWFKSHLGEPV